MAASLIQGKTKNNAAASTAVAIGSGDGWVGSTAGSLIVGSCGQFGGSPAAPTVTDNLGSTYTIQSASPRGSFRGSWFYLPNNPGGITTVTVTPTTPCSVVLREYSGVAVAPTVVVPGTLFTDQVAVTAWASNAINPAAASLLLGAAYCIFTATASFAVSGAWSSIGDFANTTDGDDAFAEEQLNASPGSVQATGTCSSNEINASVIAFSLAAGGAAAAGVALPQAVPVIYLRRNV